MFLAFPAILPATITLIADKEDRAGAQQNVEGAIAGGIGLVAFAVTAYVALAGLHWSSSLALALAAWIATSISSYLILELTAFGHGSSSDGGSGPTDP
jgi:hypothetical protein